MCVYKELNIKIKNNDKLVSLFFLFEDGREEEKNISIFDFAKYISLSSQFDSYTKIGKLPQGYYDSSIDTNQPATFKVIVTIPGSVKEMRYYGDSYIIPFPEMTLMYDIKKGALINSKAFAIRKENNKKILCHYPFGNVHDDGEICWGRTSLPQITFLSECDKYSGLFFGSETNNDLYHVGRNIILEKKFVNQRGLLEDLINKTTFPNEWLITCYNDIISYSNSFLL